MGWRFGGRPFFVAVHCAYGHIVEVDEAVDLAMDYALEQDWFGSKEPSQPDYVIA